MKFILKHNYIFYFWAVFDLFYIVRFIWLNISQGRIPLIDDILSFSDIYPQQGAYSLVLFSFSLLLNVSIVFSAVMLLKKWKYVSWIVYFQTPFRLFFMIPSISILPWMFKTMSIKVGAIFLAAVFLSEIIKVGTFYLTREKSS
ncbi:hypothetical protein EDC48_108138 [Gibbsiella quercinecans]|uniref:Arginine:ornithine antiporter n=1 Tax=Gibbsiella quercinecans TaxID=929813 RepID=A0A250B561_9GAMM|nr:hypothetical protein [Gibbsiella quercinecans]ATA21314.1 hypothetical protein AWC35_19330 [Gibbsiella quercinecans]RLM09799.1 hypothetical protein BIY31_09175 [Gibbsiella quercinecans]RLM13485.1 hypothetical protein BIY30_05150 [Gibbsiella quercinecans]TCT88556.1 hypothetical protein EDC48_108138 [Gibbsiella quercinecans]